MNVEETYNMYSCCALWVIPKSQPWESSISCISIIVSNTSACVWWTTRMWSYSTRAHVLCHCPGVWSWTEVCWRWWTTELFLILKELVFLQQNTCSCLLSRWPSSSSQTLEPSPVCDTSGDSPPVQVPAGQTLASPYQVINRGNMKMMNMKI